MARAIGPSFELAAADQVMRELERALHKAPGLARKAAGRALRKSLRAGKAAASREIRAVINLKKKPVDARIEARVLSERALVGRVAVRDRRIPLVEFMTRTQIAAAWRRQNATRRRSRGVAVKAYKKRPRQLYAGTFVNVGRRSGRWHVMRRRTRARDSARIQYGPNLTQEFERTLGAFAARANAVLDKNLSHELAFALGDL